MAFQKAKRLGVWCKVLVGGPSGSGKTYSALRLATGLAQACGSRIAAIDSENGRMNYYAKEFDFDVFEGFSDYTPEGYKSAIEAAIDAGYKVIIVDSLTHEWLKLNELHDAMPGNSYTNWAPLKKRHNRLVEYIIQSPAHIIATSRGKDEYQLETDSRGKQIPKKIGVGMVQDKDIEYNYTVTFNLDQKTHVADATKDNTHIFEGRYDELTEKHGKALYEWANSGDAPAPTPAPAPTFEAAAPTEGNELDDIKAKIVPLASSLYKTDKDSTLAVIKKYEPSGNPKKITDIGVAQGLYEELMAMNNN